MMVIIQNLMVAINVNMNVLANVKIVRMEYVQIYVLKDLKLKISNVYLYVVIRLLFKIKKNVMMVMIYNMMVVINVNILVL